MPQTILFLCTGNYYRSRMAEEMFNYLAEQQGLDARAFSRGLFRSPADTGNVGPFSPFARQVLARYGIPPQRSHQFPQRVTADDLRRADRVIALYRRQHEPMLRAQFPECLDKVTFWSVPDLDEMSADQAGAMVYREVQALVEELRNGARR
ncbi:MAG: low molecular weight phosphatase family protein [Caldilineales bacterium]|nr:low molecular weight phosphatase family protein [Caldilineales bacterium]MDW8318980.1 low molecular weight phosphatase family protein [Anaerolineae bacterium]